MDIQKLQAILDEFEKEYWVAPGDVNGKTRHIVLHLAKLLGKIGTVSEKHDHGFEADDGSIRKEVIPDLLYFALSLSALYGIDLEKAFLERLEENKKKIKSWQQ